VWSVVRSADVRLFRSEDSKWEASASSEEFIVQLIQQSRASSHAELYVAGYADDGLPGSVGERMEAVLPTSKRTGDLKKRPGNMPSLGGDILAGPEPFPFRLNRNGGSISLFDAFSTADKSTQSA
jgi:hypothetical protein